MQFLSHNQSIETTPLQGISSGAEELKRRYLVIQRDILKKEIEVIQRFNDLAETWKFETSGYSSILDIVSNSAYQQIIGMGEDAIPLILEDLKSHRDTPDHWFWALRSIKGFSPIEEEQRGKIKEMANAWITWGENNGLL